MFQFDRMPTPPAPRVPREPRAPRTPRAPAEPQGQQQNVRQPATPSERAERAEIRRREAEGAGKVSFARKPVWRMLVNKRECPGLVDASVTDNNFLAADQWSATISTTAAARAGFGAEFWSDAVDIEVEIQAGYYPRDSWDASKIEWTTLIVGFADEPAWNPVEGTVSVSGRDFTGELIDEQLIDAYPNSTASEIVSRLASRVGLTPNVTPTKGRVGQHYAHDHQGSATQFSSTRTAWDLITWLAEKEGYAVWVEGRTLHFHPLREDDEEPYFIAVEQGEIERISDSWKRAATAFSGQYVVATKLKRALTQAKDIEVTVESRDARGATNARATVRGRSKSRAAERSERRGQRDNGMPAEYRDIPLEGQPRSSVRQGGSIQAPPRANSRMSRYRIVVSGADNAECLRIAQAKLEELSRHERHVEIEMPGELALTAQKRFRVEGTNSKYDQIYWVHEITRKWSVGNGFSQSLTGKNTSPRTVQSVGEDGSETPLGDAGQPTPPPRPAPRPRRRGGQDATGQYDDGGFPDIPFPAPAPAVPTRPDQ